MEFLKAKFELLLLGIYVYFYTGVVIWASMYGHGSVSDFAVDNNKLFVGALLGLLTGRAISGTRVSDKNGNGKGANDSSKAPQDNSAASTGNVPSNS